MARTVETILNEMLTAKAADPNLAGLTSTSQASVWRLLFHTYAASIMVHETEWDLLQDYIDFVASVAPQANARWYAEETKKWQNGDTLVFQEFDYTDAAGVTRTVWRYDYAVIDTTKQIAELAAATNVDGLIEIKAAKVVGGTAQKLSAGEKTALEAYWLKKRFAGTPIVVISDDPDEAHIEYRITYDPLIMDSSGESLASPGTFPVEDAINSFLRTFSGENFAADFQVMKLTSAIEATSGVINAVAEVVECKPTGGSYSDILAVSNQTYVTAAGYMKIDAAFPLSSNLTYVAP